MKETVYNISCLLPLAISSMRACPHPVCNAVLCKKEADSALMRRSRAAAAYLLRIAGTAKLGKV